MNCPKCDGPMQAITVEDVQIDRCTRCQGLWFDLREHQHLKEIPGTAATIDTGDPAEGERMDDVRDVRCPRCHTELVKMVVLDQPHIRYERCNICGGSFLDAGEFRDLQETTLTERLTAFLKPLRPG